MDFNTISYTLSQKRVYIHGPLYSSTIQRSVVYSSGPSSFYSLLNSFIFLLRDICSAPHIISGLSDGSFMLNCNSFYHFPAIRMINISNKYLRLYHKYIELDRKLDIIWPLKNPLKKFFFSTSN